MSRVPSASFLCALSAAHRGSKSVSKTGIRQDKIFYVLNPDKNLESTQKRLEGELGALGGQGKIGEHPSLPEMRRALEVSAYFELLLLCNAVERIFHIAQPKVSWILSRIWANFQRLYIYLWTIISWDLCMHKNQLGQILIALPLRLAAHSKFTKSMCQPVLGWKGKAKKLYQALCLLTIFLWKFPYMKGWTNRSELIFKNQ